MSKRLGFALACAVALACDASNPVAPGDVGSLAPATEFTITIGLGETGSVYAGQSGPATLRITVSRNDGGEGPDRLEVAISTTLGHFGLDRTNAPVTLLMLELSGCGDGLCDGIFEFFPGEEPGGAEILGRLSDSAGRFLVQVLDPGDPPEAAFTVDTNGLQAIFADASTGSITQWRWDFDGDGTNDSSRQNPLPQLYRAPDVYAVTLKVRDAVGRRSQARQFVEITSDLVAAFDFEPGTTLLQVIFTDTSTGNPTGHSWDFGDGSTSGERNPIHSYAAPGEYLVTLDVTKGSASSSASAFVTVGTATEPPEADFEFEANLLKVLFSDASSNGPTSFQWDFGDGGKSSQQNPSHTYKASGTYEVRLTVSNAAGSDDVAKFVTVDSGLVAPGADFSFAISGLKVAFTDESAGDPTDFEWDFGDGDGSDEQNPTHTYSVADDYLVTLTVSNDEGSDSVSKFVTIETAPIADFTFEQDGLDGVFTNISTGNPSTFEWDFGDGGMSTDESPRHTYAALGSYTVKLKVTNSQGTSTVSKVITMAPF